MNLHRIINKILLFICGKTGCSKSLSIMILYKSMKGNNGEQNLFKKLPKLSMNGYQGSLSKTFRRNKKNLLEESLQKKIKMKLLICYFLMKWFG